MKHLCIFHPAYQQHLPFNNEQLICRSRRGLLRWESGTVSILRIQESERQRGVCTSGRRRGGSILKEEWSAWVRLVVLPLLPCMCACCFWGQPTYPCFFDSPISKKYSLRQLSCYSSVKLWLCFFLGNTCHLFSKFVTQREKMEMRRSSLSRSISFGLVS